MEKNIYRIYFIIAILTGIFYTSSPVGEKVMMLALVPFIIIVLFTIAIIFKNKDFYKLRRGEVVLLLILSGTYIISSIVNRGYSFRELYAYGAIIVGIMICGSIILAKDSKAITKVFFESFVIISAILSAFGMYCHQTKTEIFIGDKLFGYQSNFGNGTGGILSIMQNVNSYALVCIVAVIISIILFFMTKNKIYRALMIISAVAQTYLLLIMGSRTTLLMLACFFAFYFIFFFKSKYKKYLYVVGILLVAGLGFMILSGNVPRESVLWYKMISGDITSGRMELWTAAMQGIKENVLFGVGIRNVIDTISVNMGDLENTLGAHNGYISILLANGILVFLSIISLIVYYIQIGCRKIKNLKGNDKIVNQLMICFCLVMLVGNLTESLLFGDFNFATVMLWIILVMTSRYGEKDTRYNY